MKTFVLSIAATALMLSGTAASAQSYNSAEYQQRLNEFQQYQQEYQRRQQEYQSQSSYQTPDQQYMAVQDEQPKKKNKGVLKAFVTLAVVAGLVVAAHKTGVFKNTNSCVQQVRGYYRSNGTYVNGYTRTCPNNTVTDNFSYRR